MIEKPFRVCHVDELDHDKPRCYRVNGQDVFIVRHWDQIYALENRCGHMSAALHRGEYTDGLIVCPLHGAAYDVKTGEKQWDAILPPPMSDYSSSENPRIRQFGQLMEDIETLPIRSFPVTVEGNEVFIIMRIEG
jgi:nitrite reductase/ring-hydroxylating ferredoxin subunit